MEYKDKKYQEACQNWCQKYKSCNLEIIKYAIKNKESEKTKEKN